MPLLPFDPKRDGYPKNHIKYVKTNDDFQREQNKEACKKIRDDEREKHTQERNDRNREQFNYYIGLYEKYGTKDWDSIQMQLDKEKRNEEYIRKEKQKKIDSENERFTHFGTMRKKDMEYMFAYTDKKKWQ